MDDKTLSTTLALFPIQLNALMLLVDRHVAAGTVRADFQQLVREGVASVGLETMKEIKNRIQGSFSKMWGNLAETINTYSVEMA